MFKKSIQMRYQILFCYLHSKIFNYCYLHSKIFHSAISKILNILTIYSLNNFHFIIVLLMSVYCLLVSISTFVVLNYPNYLLLKQFPLYYCLINVCLLVSVSTFVVLEHFNYLLILAATLIKYESTLTFLVCLIKYHS